MKTKEYLINNFIPIAKEESKGLSDVAECLESIEYYLTQPEPPAMESFIAVEKTILKALLVDKMVAFKFALSEVTGYGDIERKNMERDILIMNELIK